MVEFTVEFLGEIFKIHILEFIWIEYLGSPGYSNNSVGSGWVFKPVKGGLWCQVYLAPQSPFNWFENPPGANTIIGIPWTAKVLYPDKFKDMDLKNLTKEFYSEFYHYNLTDGDVSNILSSSGLNSSNQ